MSEVIAIRQRVERDIISKKERESFLVFKNPGILDMNLVKLMGVNVKESESPIGFFGTGLKYAMAACLRLGGNMTIMTGGVKYHVNAKAIKMRNKEFQQVTLGDEPLGFTTELGKQWKPWMVVRELYSNALDENGETCILPEPETVAGDFDTVIILGGQIFLDVWNSRGQYFIDMNHERPIHSSKFVDAYPSHGHNHAVYYRGIKIWDSPEPTLFRYNILDKIDLTEDRTLKYQFQFEEALEKALITSSNKDYITSSLTTGENMREGKLTFSDQHHNVELSNTFKEVTADIGYRSPENRNKRAIAWAKTKVYKEQPAIAATLTLVQQSQLDKSIEFLGKLGYGDELAAFPIMVVDWLGLGCYGKAEKGTAFISKKCFEKGTKFLASTILEELIHLQYNLYDESRTMQTWLFDRIITMGEEHITKEAL